MICSQNFKFAVDKEVGFLFFGLALHYARVYLPALPALCDRRGRQGRRQGREPQSKSIKATCLLTGRLEIQDCQKVADIISPL